MCPRHSGRRLWIAAMISFVAGDCAKVTNLGENSDASRPDFGGVDALSALADGPRDVGGSGGRMGATDAADASSPTELTCGSPNQGSVGCSFYAAQPSLARGGLCYAMVVVNPNTKPAALKLQRGATVFSLNQVARLPQGAGTTLTYLPYDAAGLAPGAVAILFLSGPSDTRPRPVTQPAPTLESPCPFGVTAAVDDETSVGRAVSGMGEAFHLTSDRPIVAYDISPYGGAYSYVSSASLLLPVEAWTGNYIAAAPQEGIFPNFALVIAHQDGTEVSLRVREAVVAGDGVPATVAGGVTRLRLDAGQFAQVAVAPRMGTPSPTGPFGMSGAVLSSTKPVGLVVGNACTRTPDSADACDGIHQQMPPLSAWGTEYAAVRHRSRLTATEEEPGPWQIVAAVDGTELTYLPQVPAPYAAFPTPAPTRLSAGQSVRFWTNQPFVVRSQDAMHPIYLAGEMTGCEFLRSERRTPEEIGAGDPEFVNTVPTSQFLTAYTLFSDVTYPDTSLVVVRKPGPDGRFADVKLGCAAAPIANWTSVGPLQFARVDLVRGNYRPIISGCDNGVQQISSSAPFGVTVWGWASSATGGGIGAVSYAYPGGAGLIKVTDVVIPVVVE